MYWDIVDVHLKTPRKFVVTFADGMVGTVQIDHSFCTGVFEVLKNDDVISQVTVQNGVLVWPAGLDLAPDTMYKMIKNSSDSHYELRR